MSEPNYEIESAVLSTHAAKTSERRSSQAGTVVSDPARSSARGARLAVVLSSLDVLDVTGGRYPLDVTEPDDRLRWNQSLLVSLALYHAHVTAMLPGEYAQELHLMAGAIYRQSRTEFPTGTRAELSEDIEAAIELGWL